MMIIALFVLIILLWLPLPQKIEWPLWWTGILLILIGGEIVYPVTFTAVSLGVATLLTWLEAIIAILIRRFSDPSRLLQFNYKTLALMLLNVLGWLPMLFHQPYQDWWFNEQIIIWARVIDSVSTIGLIIFWLFVLMLQTIKRPVYADDIIVLGAGLQHGKVPPVLAERLNRAMTCWHLNPSAQIIVTGGQLHGENISEAHAMAKYLMGKGVPQGKITLEDHAMNTWDNLRNCRQILADQNKLGKKIVVVTSSFHVLRVRNYTQRLKLSWPVIASKTPWRFQPLTIVRDYLGIIRDHYRMWIGLQLVLIMICEGLVMFKK